MASRIKVDEVTNGENLEQLLFLLVGNFVDLIMLLEILILVGPYQNGNPFVTLPTQDASNLISVLNLVVLVEMRIGI